MPSAKQIRARIKSVKNTGKITRAMELISTVKMKKAQDSVILMRPFASQALRLFERIDGSMTERFSAPKKPTRHELLVVVSSHRGLCGAYNINTFKQINRLVREHPDTRYEYVTVGKKVRDFIMRTKGEIVVDFSEEMGEAIDTRKVRRISRTV